ncbi:MAG: hypothetical protein ACM3OC_04195 [Deltaproteobacteria bacterium]
MLTEILFGIIGFGIIVVSLRFIIRQKGPWNLAKSLETGLLALIVILLLMILFKR